MEKCIFIKLKKTQLSELVDRFLLIVDLIMHLRFLNHPESSTKYSVSDLSIT